MLFAYGRLAGSAAAIIRHRHELRAFTLLFDFAGALAAVSVVEGHRRRFWLSLLLLLLNGAYLYNTLIWEQVDAIYTCLSFGAVLLALRRRLVGSVLLYLVAFNMKLQAIIFLPALLLLWLPLARAAPWRLAEAVGVAAVGAAGAAGPVHLGRKSERPAPAFCFWLVRLATGFPSCQSTLSTGGFCCLGRCRSCK